MIRKFYLLIIFVIFSMSAFSVNPLPSEEKLFFYEDSASFFSVAPQKDRFRARFINITLAGSYVLSMTWLNSQWYKNYPRSSFHFFNDNSEWEQMDKYAHVWDAYNISKPIAKCYRWAGYSENKSTWIGSGIAFAYQTSVEVLDGFSSQWGFSLGDAASNALGVGLYTFQQLHWKEQRITLKFSFSQSKYAAYRPDLLGKNLQENILKDYNGLTYWISVNPRSFFKSSTFPSWLSLAFGFGADGMTGGKENPSEIEGRVIPVFERYKQYYFSVDIELYRLNVRSQFWSSLFKIINIIHLPSPAIEISNGKGVKFHTFFF